VSTNLEQLMHEANVLAGQVQRERLSHPNGRAAGPELQKLEQRLRQTWIAIRQARLEPAGDPAIWQRHPKWG
jgi:hypothetical protein